MRLLHQFLPVTDASDYSWAGKLERKAVSLCQSHFSPQGYVSFVYYCTNLQKHRSTFGLMHAFYSFLQADREQLTQLAFEEFNMTGFFLCDQPVCSLYAVGRITGTVVDLGYAKTGRSRHHCIAYRQ